MSQAPAYPVATFVTDPDTGERLIIEHDRGYIDLLSAHFANQCPHSQKQTFRFKVANGAVQVRQCCQSCGQAFGTALSQKDRAWVATLPWLPDDLATNYEEQREATKQRLLIDLGRKQTAERGAFTTSYTSYLSSPEWKAKRELVMKRCGRVCEGCGLESATEVHHHHYDHLFDEFLFELVGLCNGCHARITEERKEHREAAIRARVAEVKR